MTSENEKLAVLIAEVELAGENDIKNGWAKGIALFIIARESRMREQLKEAEMGIYTPAEKAHFKLVELENIRMKEALEKARGMLETMAENSKDDKQDCPCFGCSARFTLAEIAKLEGK